MDLNNAFILTQVKKTDLYVLKIPEDNTDFIIQIFFTDKSKKLLHKTSVKQIMLNIKETLSDIFDDSIDISIEWVPRVESICVVAENIKGKLSFNPEVLIKNVESSLIDSFS